MRRTNVIPTHLAGFISTGFLLFAGTACTTGQTGGEVETDDGGALSGEFARCEETRSPIALDEPTALGFQAGDLVTMIEGMHESSFSWAPSGELQRGATMTVSPDAGDSTITLTVVPLAESANYVHRTAEAPEASDIGTTEDDIASEEDGCADTIEIDADVSVVSENGAFDDSFRTTFQASSAAFAKTRIELSPGQLTGSFDVSVEGLPGAELRQTTLDLGFVLGTLSGQISGLIEVSDGESTMGSPIDYGRFPIESCASGYLLEGTTTWATNLKALLAQADSFDWVWQDGGETTFGLDPALGQICFENNESTSTSGAHAALTANVATADDRLSGTWDLAADIELDASGEITRVSVFRDAYLARVFSAEEFEATTGIQTDSVADELSFQFGYIIEPVDGGLAASGSFAVLELNTADCTTGGSDSGEEPNGGQLSPDSGEGTEGCSGTDFVERDLGSFTLAE